MAEYQMTLEGTYADTKENHITLRDEMRRQKYLECKAENDSEVTVEYQPSFNSNGDFTGYQAIYRGE